MEKKKSSKNFVIPKKPKLDLPPREVEEDDDDSSIDIPDGYEITEPTPEQNAQLIDELNKKSLDKNALSEECWKQMSISRIQIIRNENLEHSFNSYKKKHKVKEEVFEYRVVYEDREIQKIAEDGLCVGSDAIMDIGDSSRGVMLYNSPALAYSGRFLYGNVPVKIMAFRVANGGKRNEVPPTSAQISPSKKHNCHVLMKTESNSAKLHRYILEHCQAGVYHYEYLPNTSDIYINPSMLLPHAIITYELQEDAQPNMQKPFSKINRTFINFQKTESCKHTLVFDGKNVIEATLFKPYTTRELPDILVETTATPSAYHMKDIDIFPELLAFRSPELFGKLLTSEAVYAEGHGMFAHYLLRFSAEYQRFVEKICDHKSMLVWGHYPWTVFYLPSGEVAADFGFPYQENCFHVVVQRQETEENFRSFFIGQEDQDLGQYWIAANENERIHRADLTPVEFAEPDGDETDSEAEVEVNDDVVFVEPEVHTSPSIPVVVNSPIVPKGIIRTLSHKPRDLKVKWNDEEHPNHKKGAIAHVRIFTRDAESPNDHYEDSGLSFDEKRRQEASVEKEKHVEAENLKAEKLEKEEEGTDKLFKEAMQRNLDYEPESPAYEARPSTSSQTPAYECGPSPVYLPDDLPQIPSLAPHSVTSPVPVPPVVFPTVDVSRPPNINMAPQDVSPTNVSFPPPPILPNIHTPPPVITPNLNVPPPVIPQQGFAPQGGPPLSRAQHHRLSSPRNLSPNTRLPPFFRNIPTAQPVIPPNLNMPPPSYSQQGFLPHGVPPPPRIQPQGVPLPNISALSQTIPPPGLYIPPARPSPYPSCLVPSPGPPVDPRLPSTSGQPTIAPDFSVPPPTHLTSVPSTPVTPVSAPVTPATVETHRPPSPQKIPSNPIEEKGEEPMDLDETIDEEGQSLVNNKQESNKDEQNGNSNTDFGGNDLLEYVNKQTPREEIKSLETAKIDYKILETLRPAVMALLEQKSKEQVSTEEPSTSEPTLKDTDLRPTTQIKFGINKPKQPATKNLNVLKRYDNDDDEEEEEEEKSGSSQDSDYSSRKSAAKPTQQRRSQDTFPNDRDDRLQDIDERFSNIPLPKQSAEEENRKRIADQFQGKLRASGKTRENIVSLHQMSQTQSTQPVLQTQTSQSAQPSTSFSKMFPGLMNTQFTKDGLSYSKDSSEGTAQPADLKQEEPEPEQIRSPSPEPSRSSGEADEYVPKSFLSQKPKTVIVPVESKDGYETYHGERPSSSIENKPSPKKGPRKPIDHDSVKPSNSDQQAIESWGKMITNKSPVKKKENTEDGELDSDEDKKNTSTSSSSSSVIIISPPPKKRPLPAGDAPPGITYRPPTTPASDSKPTQSSSKGTPPIQSKIQIQPAVELSRMAMSSHHHANPHQGAPKVQMIINNNGRGQFSNRGARGNYQNRGNHHYQPGFPQLGYQHPGFQHPGYQHPGYQHPGYQHPGYQHPGFQQPGFTQPGFQNGNNYHLAISQSHDWMDNLPPVIDPSAHIVSILVDPDLSTDALKQAELNNLFEVLLELKKKSKPCFPRVHATVYLHDSVYQMLNHPNKQTAKYFHVFTNYKICRPALVEILPRHFCDINASKVSDLAQCFAEINRRRGGKDAIFLTGNQNPTVEEMMLKNGIQPMNIRQIASLLEGITGDPMAI